MTGAFDVLTEVRGERLLLMPERAVFWESERTLIVADPHLGKDAAFRAMAVPMPGDASGDDLARLGQALSRTGAERLVILGDLFHAPEGLTDGLLRGVAAWRHARAALDVLLVAGNHDATCGELPSFLGIRDAGQDLRLGPFLLRHEPDADPAGYVLAGHVHPAVVLRGRGRQRETLPCFLFGETTAVLPAFGSLTGWAIVRPKARDRVYVLADGEVVEAR